MRAANTPSRRRYLVTGASGFHGHAVANAAAALPSTLVSGMYRKDARSLTIGVSRRIGDLRNKFSLRAALTDVDTVVHCGGYVGYDPELCRSINVEGTANLVEEACSANVTTLLYISTCAVYGHGGHSGGRVGTLVTNPNSVLSESRLAAENIVLDAGGTVLRPNLVYGAGDRWVVPGLIGLTRAIGGLVNGGAARLSVIHVDELATLATAMADARSNAGGLHIAHAATVPPVTLRNITAAISKELGIAFGLVAVEAQTARSELAIRGLSAAGVDMVATDHWYESESPWRDVALAPPTTFKLNAHDVAWYRGLLD